MNTPVYHQFVCRVFSIQYSQICLPSDIPAFIKLLTIFLIGIMVFSPGVSAVIIPVGTTDEQGTGEPDGNITVQETVVTPVPEDTTIPIPTDLPLAETTTEPVPAETPAPEAKPVPVITLPYNLSPNQTINSTTVPNIPSDIAEMKPPGQSEPLLSLMDYVPETTSPAAVAPGFAPLNPDFIEYQKRMEETIVQESVSPKMSPAAVQSGITTPRPFIKGRIPSPVDLSNTKGQLLMPAPGAEPVLAASYESSYDLRPLGKVSPVKDQLNVGSCWAFAALASLESILLPGESYDFSENHMKNTLADTYPDGFDRTWDDGGNEFISSAYLTRWSGPVFESDDPYSNKSGISPAGLVPVKHAQNIHFLPPRSQLNDTENIKYALKNYGAVEASIAYDPAGSLFPSSYDPANATFYNWVWPGLFTNHAVTIVGWDDSFSGEKFAATPFAKAYNITPLGDGAFIVKNSWGTGWGDGGYFYVSYYDVTIGDYCVAYTADPTTNYDRVYSFDPLGWVADYNPGSSSGQFANIYTAQSAEVLQAAGFYTQTNSTSYTISVYRNPNNGPVNSAGPVATTSGVLTSPGYHTITLPNVTLAAGQKYSIVASVTTPGYNYPVPVELPIDGYSSHATAHAGESYVSSDGTSWKDMTTIYPNTSVCLKGYTMLLPTVTSVSPSSTYLNTSINFTILGRDFHTGTGNTYVNFTKTTRTAMHENLNVSLFSVTPTRIDGAIHFRGDLPIGAWNLTVTTTDNNGTSSVRTSPVKSPAIAVGRPPAPVILTVSPATPWMRNTTVPFSITGTNFRSDQTMVYLVNQSNGALLGEMVLTNISETRIDGTIHVPHDAPAGKNYAINISTIDSGFSGTRFNAFSVVKVPAMTIGGVNPARGTKNTTVNITITGTNIQTGDKKTRVRIYENVMDTELDVTIIDITPVQIACSAEIPNGALAGSYSLEVMSADGGIITREGVFTVGYPEIPVITAVSPAAGNRNDTIRYTITGRNFQPGKTRVVFLNQSTGAALGSSVISSTTSTRITGDLVIPGDAPAGYYRAGVITIDGGNANKANAFRVTVVKTPVISAFTPGSGAKGSTVAFTLIGDNFQALNNTAVTLRDLPSGTEAAAILHSVTPTKIIGSVTVPAKAPSGTYVVEVRTADGGTVVRPGAFTVTYLPLPLITSLNPAGGSPGSTVPFVLKGDYFVDGGTTVKFRKSGTTMTATLASVNTTTITGTVAVPGAATPGPCRLDVITDGGGFSSRLNAFTVQ